MKEIRELCREVDLLHPSIDDGGRRPDNCEYPWLRVSGGEIVPVAPKSEHFRIDERLRSATGVDLLKVASFLCHELAEPANLP